MNQVARAQAAAYGRHTTSKVMSGGPTMNLKHGDSNRNINMNNNHARGKIVSMLDNRQVRDRSVALYDPKSIESPYNYLMRGDNSMLQKMQQDGRKKIEFKNEELIPDYNFKYNLDGNSLDQATYSSINSYYPKLPVSAYNKPPVDMKPTIIDDRIRQHTTDREYAWGDDQENLQRNILKDPKRWERIQRQNEADRRLYGMGVGTDRWVENKNAYSKRPEIIPEYLMDNMINRIETTENLNRLDDEELERSIRRASLAPVANFEVGYDTNHRQSGNSNFLQNRQVNYYNYNQIEPYQAVEKKSIIDNVVDTIMSLFKKTDHMSEKNKRQREEAFDAVTDVTPYTDISMNRIRNDTTFAIREGKMFTIAPDNYEVYGSTFVSPVSKMMAILNNGQLHIVQKMKADRILGSDARPVGDDLIVTVMPKAFTEKMRTRIHNSEGRKIKELNTSDFIELLEFIENNPSIQKRTTVQSIARMLGDSAIDKAMLGDFGGQHTLVQNDALDIFMPSVVRNGVDINKDAFRMREDFEDDQYAFESKAVAIPRTEAHQDTRRAATFTNRNVLEEAEKYMTGEKKVTTRNYNYTTAPRIINSAKNFSDML